VEAPCIRPFCEILGNPAAAIQTFVPSIAGSRVRTDAGVVGARMLKIYRIFRTALTALVLITAAWLVAMVLVDLAGDPFLEGMPDGVADTFESLASIETISGFWPILMLATGLVAGMRLESFTSRLLNTRAARARRAPLAIVYDPNDHRFVHREFPNAQLTPVTRFRIGICNRTGSRPFDEVVVSTNRSAFAKATLMPIWGSRTQRIERIAPNETEFVDVLGLTDYPASSATAGPGKVQRFIIRAAAKNARRTSAKFEFNALATPAIRRLW
jgi:hypothetical protein